MYASVKRLYGAPDSREGRVAGWVGGLFASGEVAAFLNLLI